MGSSARDARQLVSIATLNLSRPAWCSRRKGPARAFGPLQPWVRHYCGRRASAEGSHPRYPMSARCRPTEPWLKI